MESPLEVVRDRRTGVVLFHKKPQPPFKIDPLQMYPPKNDSTDVLPSKNVQVTTSNFRKAAADAGVQLDFGDDYGFSENLRCLEKTLSFSYPYEERSKHLGDVANSCGPREIIEEAKNLSQDVYKLFSEQDMLNQFGQQNLL